MKTSPPIAPKFPHDITTHGDTRQDPYFWMREKDRPDLLDYIRAENEFVEAGMGHTKALQQTLYDEMLGRIQETDQSVPIEKDGRFYYTRTEAGLQYPIYCRKSGNMQAAEEVLLDPNKIAAEADGDYLKVGIYAVSPDHKTLAYSLDFTGGERYTVHFKNLESGAILPDQIENVGYDFEWANDSRTVFFDRVNDEWRSFQIWRFTFGDGDPESTLVFQEDDVEFGVGLDKTRDDKYLLIEVDAAETSEVYLVDADAPEGPLKLIAARENGVDYWAEHRDGLLYILTNRGGATNFKLCTAPAENPGSENWTDFIGHRPEVRLAGFAIFDSHIVLLERENGLERFMVQDFASGDPLEILMDEPVYTVGFSNNPNFKSGRFRYVYGSMTTPSTVLEYDFGSGEQIVLKQDPVPGYDPSRYETTRIWATAADGAQVPISLVYQKGLELNGQNPCLLYGYGSYGVNQEPNFNGRWVSLVDRGFVCAIAHVRGSETMGRQWYEDGKWLKKRNTFTDFVAAGRHLIAQGYTSPEKMAVWGRSAGGLLIGATVNLAPDMMAAAIADVPFVDVVSTMLDESIPLTTGEFREWGNPKDKEYYDYMLSYSPYDNVEAKAYPAILATSGYNDPRVQYWEPTKWVAKLRVTKTGDAPLFLYTNMGAGHGGASGRYDYLKEYAFRLAFLIDQVGDR